MPKRENLLCARREIRTAKCRQWPDTKRWGPFCSLNRLSKLLQMSCVGDRDCWSPHLGQEGDLPWVSLQRIRHCGWISVAVQFEPGKDCQHQANTNDPQNASYVPPYFASKAQGRFIASPLLHTPTLWVGWRVLRFGCSQCFWRASLRRCRGCAGLFREEDRNRRSGSLHSAHANAADCLV